MVPSSVSIHVSKIPLKIPTMVSQFGLNLISSLTLPGGLRLKHRRMLPFLAAAGRGSASPDFSPRRWIETVDLNRSRELGHVDLSFDQPLVSSNIAGKSPTWMTVLGTSFINVGCQKLIISVLLVSPSLGAFLDPRSMWWPKSCEETHQILKNCTPYTENGRPMHCGWPLRFWGSNKESFLPMKGGSSSLGIFMIERRKERFPTDFQIFKSGSYKKAANQTGAYFNIFGILCQGLGKWNGTVRVLCQGLCLPKFLHGTLSPCASVVSTKISNRKHT